MTTELPSGVVTFLFSDIEGSTRLLYQLGDDKYKALVERHRAVLRAAFSAHGGQEVRTEGDSFFVAFERVGDAVAGALDGQAALARQGLEADGVRVRMGIHTGEALVADGDYFGLAVHQAARIAAVGHGGQVLVSGTAADLLGGGLPERTRFEDLGEHRLKDLERPHRLLQLCHADLSASFPPLRSLELVRHNIPVQTSSFVGRELELAEVAKVLAAGRLVSLLGPGGTGKTRLAYQVCAEAIEDFADGIWVVELGAVTDDNSVALALLRAIGLREEPSRDPTDTVVAYLRDSQVLVTLDNCEHVVGAAAILVEALLSRCPKVRVLVTSREALRVPGEVGYHVPGMRLPSAALPDYLDALADADAVRLFVARAGDVRSGFSLRSDNAADIASLCARLDQLPLAIELAASRMRSLSVRQVSERLGGALDLLSRGARTADPRQATLRGAIEWSHQLLTDLEQVLFRRVAVFTGGWRLEAAEQVCAGASLDQNAVLDTLESLVDKSLVALGEDDDGEARYRLLDTIGAYAAERLEEVGEKATFARRHAKWCCALADGAADAPVGSSGEAAWFDRLEADQPNLVAGLEYFRSAGDEADELELAGRLGDFWLARGRWRVARDQLGATVRANQEPSTARVNVLTTLGRIARRLGDYPAARAHLEDALAVARGLAARRDEGRCIGLLAEVAESMGDHTSARSGYEEALAIAHAVGDRASEGRWIGGLGNVSAATGDHDGAGRRYEDALAIFRELGDRSSEGFWTGNLGWLAVRAGDYPEARSRYEHALSVARELGDRGSEGQWVGGLGNIAASKGDYAEATSRYGEALTIARDLGDRRSEGIWVGNLGNVAAGQGKYEVARKRYAEALAVSRDLGDRRSEAYWIGSLGQAAASQGDYREARTYASEALVLARDQGDRRSEGFWIVTMARAALGEGDLVEASDHLLAGLALARDLDLPELGVAAVDQVASFLSGMDRHDAAVELVAWADESRRQTGLARDQTDRALVENVMGSARAALSVERIDEAAVRRVANSVREMIDHAEDLIASAARAENQDGFG